MANTCLGTCVTVHPNYPALAVKYLAQFTEINFRNIENLIAAKSNCVQTIILLTFSRNVVDRVANEKYQYPVWIFVK
ncbi:hypothetical protein F1D95_22710 [Escherichia coli]|nr:hypothetical protein [Escherichia coli]EEV5848608.1 hypothetical protein [Escherichia coli]EEW0594341.1 hypothetical protein [Escherichia coli]EEY9630759.1 hypothetical protein [Escherichia coli]EFB1526659.1 hypothetical protein [Escherichia coli]